MTIQLPAETGALKAPIISSINSSLVRAVNDPGIVVPPAIPFDPSTLAWVSNRKRQWWHVDEATFKNGANNAVVGDPISRAVSQSTAGGGLDFDMVLWSGSAFVLRAGYVEGNTGVYLTSLGGWAPKTYGVTIAARIAYPDAFTMLGGEDYSPLTGLFLQEGPNYGQRHLYIDVDGNANTNELDSGNIASTMLDNNYHNVAVTITPEASGNCPVKLYVDNPTIPIASGTFSAFNTSWSRDILHCQSGGSNGTKIKSRFYGMQDFSANMADIFNFLSNGSV